MSNDKKNYGIEILRLLSMFYVVIIHILMRGGVLSSSHGSSYAFAYLMKCITYCAVNCFAIITGYVNFSQEPKKFYYSKFLRLWAQVVTYSFGIQLIAFIFGWQKGLGLLLFSAFPIISGQYWFFSCYAGLFVLMPWINTLMRTLNTKQSIRLSALLFLFFSFIGTAAAYFGDSFAINEGFSVLWLVVLYIIGATLKKISIDGQIFIKSKYLIATLLLCTLSMWALGLFIPKIENIVVIYNSPFEVIIAVCYFLLFHRIKISNNKIKKLIFSLSGSAFGVYLIHMQSYIKTAILLDAFAWISDFSTWLIPPIVTGSALAIFVACLIIDEFRRFLFRILCIDNIIRKIETLFNKFQDRIEE